ncbi:hypothetical protein [Actinomadura xylanilytica]|uniref:hypothetical protein n=1 Tax=Actinomadura xylanilytica TaxID=887459 RepID=UPI00255AB5A9|nr:hypothetical protein [Actinomadura xylanilytica]MDL4773396.1 hypothetical protein [Actinomadura xylanilytica]
MDPQRRFDRATALLDAGEFDAAGEPLLEAAEGGHAKAASMLGRLLCLNPRPWLPRDAPGDPELWLRRALELDRGDRQAALLLASLLDRELLEMRPQEPWDQDIDPDDAESDPDEEPDPEEAWEAEIARRHDEVFALLDGLLAADPGDAAAAVGLVSLHAAAWDHHVEESGRDGPPLPESDEAGRALLASLVEAARRATDLDPSDAFAVSALAAALRWSGAPDAAEWEQRFAVLCPEWMDADSEPPPAREGVPSEGRYGWYVLEFGQMADNYGTNSFDRVVTADLGELRWACGKLLGHLRGSPFRQIDQDDGQPPECLTLSVYDAGRHVADVDLVPYLRTAPDAAPVVDWAAFDPPRPASPPLPPGRPALAWLSLGADAVHYGFSDDPRYYC